MTDQVHETPHCWHDAMTSTSNMMGTYTTQTCCWCGRERTKRISDEPSTGHGPYVRARKPRVTVDPSDCGPCLGDRK